MSDIRHPAEVEIVRGPMIESRHEVLYAVVDGAGKVVMAGGDVEAPIYPRSAIKPIQALAFIEVGADESYSLGSLQIALACGSHSGERRHVETVRAWLERIGCAESDLACGIHQPLNESAALALAAAGKTPGAAHNNCSGKHAGFLSYCRVTDVPTDGYIRIDHPVQQRVLGILEKMAGLDLSSADRGADGCGIPVFALPLGNLARTMAQFAAPTDQPDHRQAAISRISAAMTAEPFFIAGTGCFDTAVLGVFAGRVLVKSGAEGVCCAALPDLGLGIAVKARDGAKRAAEITMATILSHFVDPSPNEDAVLKTWSQSRMYNHAGTPIGEMRISAKCVLSP